MNWTSTRNWLEKWNWETVRTWCGAGVVTAVTLVLGTLHLGYGLRLRSYCLAPPSTEESNSITEKSSNVESPKPSGLPTNFSLLTHNIWLIFFIGGSKRRKRIDILIENIKIQEKENNLQVLCIQEAFIFALSPFFMLCGDFEYLAKKLSEIGFIYYTDPKDSLPPYIGINSGLVTFSKQPIYKYKCHTFKSQRLAKYVKRGCVLTVFKLNDNENQETEMMVVNTHFENIVAKYKIDQMNEVADVIKEYRSENDIDGNDDNVCLLSCGDFNICSNGTWELKIPKKQRLYQKLCDTFAKNGLNYDCVNELEISGIERTFRQTKVDYQASYDHVFMTEKLKEMIVKTQVQDYKQGDTVMSDHYGILVKFQRNKQVLIK